jgi:hypothetical protein
MSYGKSKQEKSERLETNKKECTAASFQEGEKEMVGQSRDMWWMNAVRKVSRCSQRPPSDDEKHVKNGTGSAFDGVKKSIVCRFGNNGGGGYEKNSPPASARGGKETKVIR